jgi:hypothetical protein
MLRKISLLIVGLIIAVAPLRGDSYIITIKKSAQGDVTKQDREETDQASFKREEVGGKVLQDRKESRTVFQSYKETILAKEKGKKATKLRREYTKAVVKIGDKEITLPFEGKSVLIEKKDGKYRFMIENGKELAGKDAELLNREFNKGDDGDDEDLEKAFLPSKPVKEGETWKIDAPVITKAFEKGATQPLPMDKDNTKGEGKLVRAYKDGDRQYADMDIDIIIPLKGDFPLDRGQTAPIGSGSQMVMKVRYKKLCIDGAAGDRVTDMSFDMNLDTTFKGPDGKEYKFSITSKHTMKNKREDLSKK